MPSRQEGGRIPFEAVPFLAAGEKRVYKITCQAVRPGSAKHSANLEYDQFDKPVVDEEGTSVCK